MSAYPRLAVLGAGLALGLSTLAFDATPLRGQAMAQAPVAQEFETLHFRSIGPATMSGRISDLAVYDRNPAIFYVGTAHSGVWKTESGGALFEPLFQDQGLISIGDVTISQNDPELVWVGAGEANNRQTSSWGGGVYKSIDGGETFELMGLEESRHVNRIVIHPEDENVVLVAAVGPLFGPGGDRGVYKTTDGGRTWRQVLAVDENTGANDLAMAATDPNILFASTYQRRRTACCMNGGGPGSGIWKSTDGGETWTRLSGGGLPDGPLGRIALDVFALDPDIVYASIEAPRPEDDEEEPTQGVYRSEDGGTTWEQVSTNNPRPMYFSQVRIDPNDFNRVYMGGVGLQMSIDGGESWETDAAQSTHDDVHAIWINPQNSDHVLIGNDGGLAVSYDMSRTWTFFPNLPVGLFYHVAYDMERPFNICGGMQDNYNWCGPSAARQNRGIMNYDWFQIQGGDGFVAMPDLRDSRIVYTESQNGNIIRRNIVTGESKRIRPSAENVTPTPEEDERYRWNWDTPIIFSPHDPGILITAANRVFRSSDRGDSWTVISPDLTSQADRDTIVTMGLPGDEISISRHDGISAWPTIVSVAESPARPGVYYTGTDDGTVSVSRDGGATWENVTGNIPGFPAGSWVSEVVPSRFDAATVYVTVDNHRLNDYETYIWASNDFGRSFRPITANLSGEVVKTLTEDTRNPDVLYAGTETGIFLTLDRGRSWRRLKANLPTVRVDEITIHPRDNAMLVATHGRALWVLDHLEPIQEYAAAQNAAAALFSVPTALQWKSLDNRNDEFWGHQFFVGENPPTEAVINFHLREEVDAAQLVVRRRDGSHVRTIEIDEDRLSSGIQTVCWDQRLEPIEPPDVGGQGGGFGGGRGGRGGRGGGGADIPGIPTPMPSPGYMPEDPCSGGGGGFGRGGGNAGPYAIPGEYDVSLVVEGTTVDTKPMTLIMDPEVRMTAQERERYNAILEDLHEMQRRGTRVAGALHRLHEQIEELGSSVQDAGGVPGDLKTRYSDLTEAMEGVRVKFGVPLGGGGGGGGFGRGGFGGGGGDSENVLDRAGSVKDEIGGIWEMPSDALMRQYEEVRRGLPAAIDEANALLERARSIGTALAEHGITLNVPGAPGGSGM